MKYKDFKDKFKEIQIVINVNSKAIQALTQQSNTLEMSLSKTAKTLDGHWRDLREIANEMILSIDSLGKQNEKLIEFYTRLIDEFVDSE